MNNISDIGNLLLQERARRMRVDAPAMSREEELVRMAIETPPKIVENKEIFKECAETFLWIIDKNVNKRRFKMNRSQQVVLDAYYYMKELTGLIRINILKGRQQGMSTFIGACAIMEMLSRPGVRALIATEEKEGSGENLFLMYKMYVEEFKKLVARVMGTEDENTDLKDLGDWGQKDATDRFRHGDSFYLKNGSTVKVIGEKLLTSRTLQFVHLSEAAFYHNLKLCMGMMMQSLPKSENSRSTMFIETTAKEYGNDHYDGWMAAVSGNSAFKPLFLPWYIHEEYSHSIPDGKRDEFEKGLGDSEDHKYGNERALLDMKTSNAPWRKQWPGLDFDKYGYDKITLENLKFRRWTIEELDGVIPEFNRQYPTTPEMAFLANTDHVLDMNAIRWYVEKMQKEPLDRGSLIRTGTNAASFREQRGGVVCLWEHPLPYTEYVIGADLAEGLDSGDYCCGYIIKRLPFQVVGRIRGYKGRNLRMAEFIELLELAGWWYNKAWICPENNMGAAMIDGLAEAGYPHMIAEAQITNKGDKSGRFGWRNANTAGGGGMRDRAISMLQETIHNKAIGIPCEVFLEECHHFMFVNGKPQAARKGQRKGSVGEHDDAIFALIGGLFAHESLPLARTPDRIYHNELSKEQAQQQKNRKRKALGRDDWMQWV